jgi:hypothetical protein
MPAALVAEPRVLAVAESAPEDAVVLACAALNPCAPVMRAVGSAEEIKSAVFSLRVKSWL